MRRRLAVLAALAVAAANRREVFVVDYARAREVLGVEQPPTDPSAEELRKLLQAYGPGSLRGSGPDPVSVGSPNFFRQGDRIDDFRTAVGFSLVDADQEILAGRPPDAVTVITGRIDPDQVEEAVTSDPEWQGDLERVDHDGDTYYRWGPDHGQDVTRADAVRPIGAGGRLSVDDGVPAGPTPTPRWRRRSTPTAANGTAWPTTTTWPWPPMPSTSRR